MRLRHIAAAVLGLGLVLVAASVAGGRSEAPVPIDLNDGTIQVSATVAGLGSWVPYTITVRNLGEQRFEGDMLLVNRPKPGTSIVTTLPPIAGGAPVTAPLGSTAQPVAPPDAAYQVHLVLDARHRKVVTFTAPSNYGQAEVIDSAGRPVAEVPINDRNVLAVGVVSDSVEVAESIAAVRFGDLGVRTVAFDQAHPLPGSAQGLAGLVALVFDRTEGRSQSLAQARAIRDFVGFGGTVVIAGSGGLQSALSGIPAELVSFRATGTATASIQAVADLGALTAPAASTIATGTLAPTAQAVVVSREGQPLVTEIAYGAGRAVEVLYDPADGTVTRAGMAPLAWSNALGRGLERLPGNFPVGGTLMEPERIPSELLPRPADAPLPSLLVVLGLGSLYVLVVGPATFLALRSAGRPTLFWLAAPLLAVAFSLVAYVGGHGFQGGVRDQQVEFIKVAPQGAVSTLSYHGITFPLRGPHLIETAPGSLAAPLTLGYPALELSCRGCALQVAGVTVGVQEHVLPGIRPGVRETGIVYGSVRVVGEAATGSLPISIEAHLGVAADRMVGTITNTGATPVRGLRIYAYYGDLVHSAYVAASLPAGATAAVNTSMSAVNDVAPPLPARLTAGVAAGLIANAAAERALSRTGQVAVVGFVEPAASQLTVDGESPPNETRAAAVQTFPIERASGRLGNWVFARLNSTIPIAGIAGGLLNTYDIEVPQIEGLPVFRHDNRVYRNVEVYDWVAGTWRSSGFATDAFSPLVDLTAVRSSELTGGRVRVRVRESVLTWGQELVLRFADEAP